MTKEEIKIKIQQARQQGVPDDVTFKYLNDKGLIPQNKIVTSEIQKPANSGLIQTNSPYGAVGNTLQNFSVGVAQGVGSTLKGAGTLVQKGLDATVNKVLPAGAQLGSDIYRKGTELEKKATEILTPQSTAQSVGFGTEKLAEFLIPSTSIVKAQKVATGLVKGTGKVAGLVRTGVKAGTEALSSGAISTVQQGGIDDQVKTNSIVAGLFSLGGSGVSKVLGGTASKIGQKIQQTVIKPNASDFSDGFKIETLKKYNLGGSLEETLAKTNGKMNELSKQLNEKLGKSTTAINLNEIYDNTIKKLGTDKAKNFGNIQGTERVLQSLKGEIVEVAGNNGLVSIPEAQLVKRGAGTKGSWSFGNPDPDARASEKVYNAFYNELKTAIEKNSPEGVREINKQLSELIPINNAVLRRLPVDQRNAVLGITDNLALYGSLFDPKALALLGANRLAKSGKFGSFLVNVADSIKKPTSAVGQRVLGQ